MPQKYWKAGSLMNLVQIYDLDIYPERCIIDAVKAYQGIASIDLKKIDGKMLCFITSSIYDVKETAGEFSNYLLALSTKHSV